MDIEYPRGLVFQPFDSHLKKCGCYIRYPQLIENVKPRTNVAMPLKHIDYDIQVTNGLASITLQQKYLNPTQKFLEIDFSFPIDPKSCIYKFVAEFGNKRIEGVVKEKEQAKREYKEAVSQGKQAVFAQIDPNSKDIMNMEIGNLGPGQEVKISVSYLQQLNVEQNTFYQLHIPSTISPRYMNSHPGKVFAENVPAVNGEYTWTFKITLLTSRKLVYYISASHNLQLLNQNENQTETILCLSKQEKPNTDLFLLFTVQNFHLPNYVLGRTDVSSTAMLSFIPKFCELTLDDAMQASMIKKQFQTDMSAAKGEYIFLLDRSGSMGGTRIQKAKQALTLFLQSLPEDTYFNVISFGYRFESIFNDSIKYNNANLKTAIEKIQKMTADMGGTQIYEPLQSILKNKVIEGYPKQIFLLTDGGVSNTEGVIALVGRQVKYSRCHSIGIGNGCSQALIKGCSQKGKGKYIFIQDSQNPSQKIIGLLEETLTPVIDHVSLKYDKDLVQSIVPNPDSLPYILKNEVVNFYITFKGQLEKKTSFTFGYKDSLNKVPFQTNIQVDPESSSIPFVDKMAHSRVIKNLQNAAKDNKPVEDYMYYVKVTDKKQEAINQSVKHQILSEYTAFICVSKQLVDGKFEEIKDKGTEKIKIQSFIPEDFGCRNEQFEIFSLGSVQLQNTSTKFYKSAVKKKSSGGLFSGVMGSIASGVSNLFSSNSSSRAPMGSAPGMMIQSAKMKKSTPMKQSLSRNRNFNAPESLIRASKMQCKEEMQDQKFDDIGFDQFEVMQLQKCGAIIDFDLQKNAVLMDECAMVPQEKKKSRRKEEEKQSSVKIKEKQSKSPIVSKNITIESVIQQQNVDGSFSSEDLLKALFPRKFSQILNESKEENVAIAVAITYAVAKWIEKNYPEKQYGLIIKKAFSFIKKTLKLEELAFLDKHLD